MESFDPITRQCVERLGFKQICMSENISADRANFRMIYEQLAERRRQEAQMPEALKNLIGDNPWVAIQGECIAPKVQGNKYRVTEPDLYVFNLIYPSGRMDSLSAKDLCNRNGLKFVPIVATDYILPDTVNVVLDYAHGQSQLGDTLREGIVFRSKDGIHSFKAVDPLFLLKYDE